MPKVSIIVPVYNVEKYLDRCVQSLLKQTLHDIEIILVDDESPDKCPQMCDEYAKNDTRVKVIHKKNGGLSDARNFGIHAATAKYIGFVDSDDYVALDMYEVLYNNLIKENADISMCSLYNCYSDSEPEKQDRIDYYVLNNKELIEIVMKAKITSVTAVNKLYKKSLFNNIKYPIGKLSEDAFVIIELLLEVKKGVLTTEQKYYYFHRENSITTSPFTIRDLNVIEAYKKNLYLIKENFPELESLGVMRYCWAHFYVLDKIMSTKNFNEYDIEKKIIKELKNNFWKIIRDDNFNITRKVALCLLIINKNLYRALTKINNKRNKQLHK